MRALMSRITQPLGFRASAALLLGVVRGFPASAAEQLVRHDGRGETDSRCHQS